ncbi:hypothetical protein BUALT_Bualt06G0121200 [Buddleja alternifolia]|uniref:Uncharacterized protein n=1 Tax=Buddleja alternifolia TaxID=168488 RepID=A0AAV6XQF3_9LAMI|nr:hypothetical protein BUALT_Bualt06G0121200 [Buddleja alternifolia]
MDSESLQGECKFQNELLLSLKIDCKYIVSVMGFLSNCRKRRMLLVYELMENGTELRNWDKRFIIAIGDLGLARFKVEDSSVVEVEVKEGSLGNGVEDNGSVMEETESVITTSGYEEVNGGNHLGGIDRSPESVVVRVEASPEAVVGIELSPEAEAVGVVSPRTVAAMASHRMDWIRLVSQRGSLIGLVWRVGEKEVDGIDRERDQEGEA